LPHKITKIVSFVKKEANIRIRNDYFLYKNTILTFNGNNKNLARKRTGLQKQSFYRRQRICLSMQAN